MAKAVEEVNVGAERSGILLGSEDLQLSKQNGTFLIGRLERPNKHMTTTQAI